MMATRSLLPCLLLLTLTLDAMSVSAQTYDLLYLPGFSPDLPSDQGWVHQVVDPAPVDGLDETNVTVFAGVMTLGDTGGVSGDLGNLQYYEASALDFDFEEDTLEFSLSARIIESTATLPFGGGPPRSGFSVLLADRDGRYVFMGFSPTHVFLGSGVSNNPSAVPHDTTSAMRAYRVRVGSTGAVLYVDDVAVAQLYFDDMEITTPNQYKIGDLSVNHRGSAEVTQFRLQRFAPPRAEVRNFEMVSAVFDNTTTGLTARAADGLATCPSGKQVLGGGVSVVANSGDADDISIWRSEPVDSSGGSGTPDSWRGATADLFGAVENYSIQVDVLCGEVPGHEIRSSVSTVNVLGPVSQSQSCSIGKTAMGAGGSAAGAPNPAMLSLGFQTTGNAARRTAEMQGLAISPGLVEPIPDWYATSHALCADQGDWIVVTNAQPSGPEPTKSIGAVCPLGTVVVGGSARVVGATQVALEENGPVVAFSGPPVVWSAKANADPAQLHPDWGLFVTAICAPEAEPTVPRSGLVGRWNADSGFPADQLGNGDGTLENDAEIVPGLFDQAFAFDRDLADPEWLSIPEGGLVAQGDFTVDAWIQTSSLPGGEPAMIASYYVPGGSDWSGFNWSTWILRLTEDGFAEAGIRGPTSNAQGIGWARGDVDLADGQPHHLAMTRRKRSGVAITYLDLYVDGELVDTDQLGGFQAEPQLDDPNEVDPISIGALRSFDADSFEQTFEGLIDDVKIYHRDLSAAEIERIAGCGVPLTLPRVVNLDGSRFGGPSGVDDRHKLCVHLEAGEYQVELLTPDLDPDAVYTAWRDGPPPAVYRTAVAVTPEVDPAFSFGDDAGALSAATAFANTPDLVSNFTLTTPQRVYFGVEEASPLLDNRSGVSFRLSVPEPGGLIGLGVAAGMLVVASRRRSASGARDDFAQGRNSGSSRSVRGS